MRLRKQAANSGLALRPVPDRGAALRQRIELLERKPQAREPVLHLCGVTGEFLAERERRRVLQMRAADLDDVREFLRLLLQRVLQVRERRQQPMHDRVGRRDVHRRREAIVRRLAQVDMIVRMHRLLCAERAAQELVRTVRDHLVDVHVGLGAGAGLPDDQREVVVELAVDHLLSGARRWRACAAHRAARVRGSPRPRRA